MEALYKLYNNEYFGIGLFVVVVILAFSFLIILFFGKKDEKARMAKSEEQANEVEAKSELEKTEALEATSIPVEAPSEEAVLEPKMETLEDMPKANTLNEEFEPFKEMISLNNEEEKPALETPVKEPELNFDTLASVLAQNEQLEKEEIKEEKPVLLEDTLPDIFKNDVLNEEPIVAPKESEPLKVKPSFPTQFSSVYVNREANEGGELPQPEVKEPKEEIKPVRPEFELPKTLDLPKLNKEVTNNNIIKPADNTNLGINNIISNLEKESFEIKNEDN